MLELKMIHIDKRGQYYNWINICVVDGLVPFDGRASATIMMTIMAVFLYIGANEQIDSGGQPVSHWDSGHCHHGLQLDGFPANKSARVSLCKWPASATPYRTVSLHYSSLQANINFCCNNVVASNIKYNFKICNNHFIIMQPCTHLHMFN